MKMKKLLALSGGGDRGAVLVGMLHGVYRALGKDAVKWDQIAGISAGAIVGALVSQTTPYDFDKRMEHARDLFESGGFHVVTPHINLGYFGNLVNALMYHDSIYSNEAMRKLISDNYDIANELIHLQVGMYNKNSCEYRTYEGRHKEDAIIASASVPIIFPAVNIDGSMYSDGGSRHMIPVEEVIEYIEKHKGETIVVDMMICYPINCPELFFSMTTPKTSYPLVEGMFRLITDQMMNCMYNDLRDLARYLDITFEELTDKPCNTFITEKVTLRIFSPDDGRYSNFTAIDPKEMEYMYKGGKRVAMEFLQGND